MADFWTDNPFGRLVRRIGVYAAGTIPLVGAFASAAVQYADSEVFKSTKRPSTSSFPVTQPRTTTAVPTPTTVVKAGDPTALFSGSAVTAGPDSVDVGSGLDSWFPQPQLPGPVDINTVKPASNPQSLGHYFFVGAVVILGTVILVSMVRGK